MDGASTPKHPRRSRTRRRVRRVFVAFGVMVGAYVLLLRFPFVVFGHSMRAGNIVFHAREPLPPEARDIAREAQARVSRSAFFDPEDTYDVYFCDTNALFSLFALWDYKVGGFAQIGLFGHVFLRPSRIERDRLLGYSGNEVSADRSLTYFVAHEVAHTMSARRLGRLSYLSLETWQQEGYADHVAKTSFDYDATLLRFQQGDRDLDPHASGLYLRYQLLFEHLLRQGVSEETLLAAPREPGPIEAELSGASPSSGAPR